MRKELKWAALRAGLVVVFAGLTGVLIYGPFVGGLEGHFAPVVDGLAVGNVLQSGKGVEFDFTYWKLRDCRLVGVEADRAGERVMFFPLDRIAPKLLGFQQSGKWFLEGNGVEGVSLMFYHRCNPLWVTITRVELG